MNREGVVQRRTARATANQDDVPSSISTETENRHDSTDELDDLDSKETRLTLMEEVLLLGLKDKEVLINSVLISIQSHKKFFHLFSRDTLHFGMIVYLAVCEAVSWLS